ncbi:MAG: UDP-N-acetylmuramoyl-L-alanine--D-glutamate ligase [Patescibacteria group bacterium]
MQNYWDQFKDKKITVMGLGVLGRGLGYTEFLAECGADLIVTDLKTKEQLKTSVKKLSNFSNIKFVLGEHRLEDFRERDMIIKSAGVPADSIYIKEARKYDTQIEMDVSLFAKCAPEVKIIGVTGTRGKTMTTVLIYEILKANENFLKNKVHLGGNIRGVATLPLLKRSKPGDVLVCELDSWQLQGFGEDKMSPNISVFTSFMADHMNYYKNSMEDYFNDKANIFKYQKKGDVLIIRPGMKKLIKKTHTKGKLIGINKDEVKNWKFSAPGEHNLENLACAVKVAEQFNIPISKIKKAVADFKGIEGRLQFLRNYKGVKIYNDNNSTTPAATIAGLRAVGDTKKRRVVLIIGGDDKKLDTKDLLKEIPKWCSKVVMFKERGTDNIRDAVFGFVKKGIEVYEEEGLENTVKRAISVAKKGETVLYSPGFSSFGKYFKNEYERNDKFVKIIKSLK